MIRRFVRAPRLLLTVATIALGLMPGKSLDVAITAAAVAAAVTAYEVTNQWRRA